MCSLRGTRGLYTVTILSELLSIIATALCGYIVWLLKKRTDDRNDYRKCLIVLMRNLLKDLHDEYMQRGWICSEEYSEYMEAYSVYAHMGGNGLGHRYAE